MLKIEEKRLQKKLSKIQKKINAYKNMYLNNINIASDEVINDIIYKHNKLCNQGNKILNKLKR